MWAMGGRGEWKGVGEEGGIESRTGGGQEEHNVGVEL